MNKFEYLLYVFDFVIVFQIKIFCYFIGKFFVVFVQFDCLDICVYVFVIFEKFVKMIVCVYFVFYFILMNRDC